MGFLFSAAKSAVSSRGLNRRHFWGWLNAVFNKLELIVITIIITNKIGIKIRLQGPKMV